MSEVNPVRGMAFRYIGDRYKDDMFEHKIHYFVGFDPCGGMNGSWIFVADLPGVGRQLHWSGFPQEFERWPEKDKDILKFRERDFKAVRNSIDLREPESMDSLDNKALEALERLERGLW